MTFSIITLCITTMKCDIQHYDIQQYGSCAAMLSVVYAECQKALHAECHYAECRFAERRGAYLEAKGKVSNLANDGILIIKTILTMAP
jgi:hypothetical protein